MRPDIVLNKYSNILKGKFLFVTASFCADFEPFFFIYISNKFGKYKLRNIRLQLDPIFLTSDLFS